ncbi:MAG: tetratricopeptide repeat protein [Burkholderiales bacterium]|nr:tetratricopeptide repeat protein [Burkholderiales bacterium]
MANINRNDPCTCGSGKKYKHCCINLAAPKPQQAAPMTATQKLQMAQQLFQMRRFDDAQAMVKPLLKTSPQNADLWHFLGAIQSGGGQGASALESLQRASKLAPGEAKYWFTLSDVYGKLGQADKAIAALREATKRQPRMFEAHFNLGNVLRASGRNSDAVTAYRAAVEVKPDFAQAWANLGDALRQLSQLDEAVSAYRQALQVMPNSAQIHSNLGLILQRQGRVAEALACFRKALTRQPDFAIAASNELLAAQYFHGYSATELFDKHRQFGERFETALKAVWPRHGNERNPDRRLKIGYVSPDLRAHSVAYFMRPVFQHHDKQRFEVSCYYSNTFRDAITDQIEADVDHWIPCETMSDEELAAKIQADGIDILIDLSGHTAGNRLLMFARKPAPVQVTWVGYPGTTGLTAMDYRLTDRYVDPVGVTEAMHTEKLVRLSNIIPFTPSPDSPPVNALPALSGAPFTFACLNNISKLNERVFATWAQILAQLPGSRLVLGNAGDEGTRQWLFDQFQRCGVSADRLVLKPRLAKQEYFSLHHEIDLALDCYPYTGGTTTMHSLWMGVPVITLRGDRPAALQGAGNLSHVGLPQFVAQDEQDYVRLAVQYARDLGSLNRLRQGLREQMGAAVKGDSQDTVRELEQIYRQMWRAWCASHKA